MFKITVDIVFSFTHIFFTVFKNIIKIIPHFPHFPQVLKTLYFQGFSKKLQFKFKYLCVIMFLLKNFERYDIHMGNISLTNNNISGTTSVSNIFIDKYMPNANGEFVKIFLYLLRCSSSRDSNLSICKIADTFKYTENDVVRALMYWEQFGLLSITYSSEKNISGICINEYARPPVTKVAPSNPFTQNTILSESELEETITSEEDSKEPEFPKKRTYTADELADFNKEEEVVLLMHIAEQYLGRPLTKNDTNTLLYIYDGLHFPFELIDYLIEYCVSNNHTSIRYIEKVALEWANNDITTVELAKSASEVYSKKYSSIIKAFGIKGRSLGKVEKDYIAKWTDEYGFDIDIILDACNRTINATHQPSFKYADSILTKWNTLGIKALSDIKALDKEHTPSKNLIPSQQVTKTPVKKNMANFTQRTYDFDKLEKELLANTGGGY